MIVLPHPAPRQPQVSIPYRTPGEFLYRDDPHTQCFTVDAAHAHELLTAGGMQLHIPAGAFINSAQKKGVSGDIKLTIKELYTPLEILCFGRPTTSNGALLEATVQFQIRAFQQGHPLDLALPLQIRMPVARLGKKPQHQLAFSGDASSIRTLSGQKTFDWKYTSALNAITTGGTYRQLSIDRCGWWACQKAHPSKARKTMLSARVTGHQAASGHLEGLLLFRDIPALVRMYTGVHGFAALNIPEGLQVAVLVFGTCGDALFAGRSLWEDSSRRLFNVPVKPIQKEAFREMLGEVFAFQVR